MYKSFNKFNKQGKTVYSLKEKKYTMVETWCTYDESGKLVEKKQVYTQKKPNAENLLYTTVIEKYHHGEKTVTISSTFEDYDGSLFTI